jgi:ubiquinone/menaquinone biosynthesis C-methylase UbiE
VTVLAALSDAKPIDRSSTALAQAQGLLQSAAGSPAPAVGDGHIDLLGAEDASGSGMSQRVFASKWMPWIYERLNRPLVARTLFGMRGMRASKERELTLAMLEISPGDRVLDVGCGTGNFSRYMAQAAGDGLVVGLDASKSMISAAAKRGGGANLAYVRGDGAALPFGDAEFDAVCCTGVIHLIDDPMRALDEMVRVLAPAGRLGLMATYSHKDDPGPGFGGMRMFRYDALTDPLARHGFTDIKLRAVRRAQFVSARKPVQAQLATAREAVE